MNGSVCQAPLRIGVLFEFGTLNGGERSLLAVLDQLAPQNVQPFAVCPPGSPLAEELNQRHWKTISPPEHWTKGTLPPETVEFLNQWANENELHLLHANSLTMARRIGTICPDLKLPVTGHVRDIMSLSASSRAALQQLSGLVAVSEATRTALLQQGFPSSKIKTIYNGIDASRFRTPEFRNEFRRELGLADDALLAVNIGQICLRKGQDDFARAAVLLKDRMPNLHFLLVGQRHSTKPESIAFEEEVDAIFESAGLSDRYHRIPFHPKVSEVLSGADILVHSARQEPLGRVLLEAAACSVPIVATDVGGTPEILTHGVSAFLVPPNSSRALAEGIEWVLGTPNRSREFSLAAEKTVREQFSVSRSAEAIFDYWCRTLTMSSHFPGRF